MKKLTRHSLFMAGGLLALPLAAQGNLIITPTYDSSITALSNAAKIEVSINAAITQVESYIKNPITVNIDFQNTTSGLGSNSSTQNNIAYSQYRSDLATKQTLSSKDTIAIASLPIQSTEPVNGGANVQLTLPLLRALGETSLGSNGGGFDGTIALNTSLTNVSRTGTQNGSLYDLESVAIHEISEVLGSGGYGSNISFSTIPGPLDLFRYTAPGVRTYSTSTSVVAYFSIDGGVTNINGFNQAGGGSDYSDWVGGATHQVQDAFGTPGAQLDLGPNELTAFDVIGYNVAPEPSSIGLILFASLGVLRRHRR